MTKLKEWVWSFFLDPKLLKGCKEITQQKGEANE